MLTTFIVFYNVKTAINLNLFQSIFMCNDILQTFSLLRLLALIRDYLALNDSKFNFFMNLNCKNDKNQVYG
ncbi:MAG TPA: hypothetical protein DDY04_00735 [Bacteroidales bacterium]|nr:hypothetical protein [Bacteroidales bacterium]